MKTIKFLSMAILAGSFLASCSSDDNSPEEINEEETITTMTVTLTPDGGGTAIELQTRDLDGDGPNPPVITVSGNLAASTTYNGSIELLNETETPAEDITEEVAEEDDEHQFIFETSGSIASVSYSDEDGDGNPVGLAFALTTDTAGSATFTVILRHEPKKPNNGTKEDAGGETDITQTFNLTVE